MLFSKYLGSFTYYNLILLFLFSITVNSLESFSIINSISYVLLHFVIIYLSLYYYRKLLYIIYFFCGLGIDLLLLNNQIGPHLFFFMTILIFFNQTKKYYLNLNSKKIYLIILLTQSIIIFFEMIITHWLFDYNFELYAYIKLLFISLVISYPIFFIFSKIDNLN